MSRYIYEKYENDRFEAFDDLYESFVLLLKTDGKDCSVKNLKILKNCFYESDQDKQDKLFGLLIKEISDYLDYKRKPE